MKLLSSFTKIAALALCLGQSVHGLAVNMTKRTVTSSNLINDFRGAVLVLGSLQTSCEVALLDSQNGMVAASCFIFLSSGKVDNSKDFKIGINDPSSSTSLVYTLDRIDVHPKYNPSTYANNIAIIGFNTDRRQSWEAWTAGDRSEWNSVFFASRAMISVSKKTWNPTRVVSLGLNSGCASASNLYKSNSDYMLCVSQAAVSLANSYCDLPYGTAWGVYQPNDLAVGAIYSHSVITSDSLCQATGTRYHIYTLIEPYLPWAGNVADETFNLFTLKDYSSSASRSFSMTSVSGSSISGSKIVSGDFYPMQRVYKPVAVTAPTTPSTPSTGGTSGGSTGGTSGGSTNTGSTNTGSTNTGSTNTGSTNTGSTNTGSTNTGSTNTGSTNTGSTNTGSTNTGSTNTGSTNTGSTNTGSTNTGSTNTGSTNTGSTNTGSTNNSGNETTNNGSDSGTTGNNNNGSSNNNSNGSTDNNSNGSSNGNGNSSSASSSNGGSIKSSSSSSDDESSLDTNGRNVTDRIDEGDVITINGSVVAIADLMTNSNEANLEVTHVYYLTQTDANGNVVVMSDIEVETYAYSDYHDNTDDEDSQNGNGSNPKDSSGLNASADNEKYNGLSRSAVIAIGVVVPVVTILILIGLFFLHKWWRRRRNAINWDPKSERDNINRIGIIDEMGMADGDRPSTESNSNTISPSNAHSRVVSAQLGQDEALADVDLNDAPAAGVDGANAQEGANAEPLFKPGHETLPPVYNSHNFNNVKLPGEKVTYS